MPQSPTSDQFAKELEDLRIAYAKNLPNKITEAISEWQALNPQLWDSEAFQAFFRSIHNLAGGAGTYGMHEVSTNARNLLGLLKPILKTGTAPAATILEQISTHLSGLRELADNPHPEAAAPPPSNGLPQIAIPRPSGDVTTSEIFLVDDDPEQAHYLSVALEQAGHHVTRFESLEATRVALQVLEPTAILMDMMFPEGELAGAQLIEEIQENRQIPVPIIFISARQDLEARLEAVRAGASHYFTKPVQIDKLLFSLSEIKPTKPTLKRILIVDDDDAIGMLFATHITQEDDWEAHLLTFPENLLLEMGKIQPDLVLMDFHMPDCNGLELMAVLKQHEDYHTTPVIFLSEDIDFEIMLSATHLGSEDYLPKAIGPDRIVQAIKARLRKMDASKPNYHNPYKWLKN